MRTMDTEWDNKLYRALHENIYENIDNEIEVKSIPYFAWANRQPGEMQVWHYYR
jgi:DUF1680 family protein